MIKPQWQLNKPEGPSLSLSSSVYLPSYSTSSTFRGFFVEVLCRRFFDYVLLLLHRGPDRVCLCDGRFNNFKASSDISPWSWLNQVGPYQYYIVSLSSFILRTILIPAAWFGRHNFLR